MFKFFRQIRQKLLHENQFSKYLIYAIGEIVLIVIGIMIALQLNNWNERRKGQLKIDDILKQVQDELTTNIYYSNDLLAVYKTKEKDLAKVLRKEVTLEDYKNDDLVNLIISYTIANISDDQANELSEYSDFLSPQQDSLITEINYLYSYVKPLLDIMY